MRPIETAILRTILYADVFHFPLTLDELHRYLISDITVSRADLEHVLTLSTSLRQHLHHAEGYICLQTRQNLIALRAERERISEQLWQRAIGYGQWLSHIPFVQMVALTGALAVRNPASLDDDFDYLLITRPGRVWLARAFAVLIVRIVRLFGHELCPNYVMASDQLRQKRQNLYIAHEMMQMRPIYGKKLYHAINAENQWTSVYLPNARPHPTPNDRPRRLRRVLEWLFGGKLGDAIENWEYQRKLNKFQAILHETPSAEINAHSVKGHFQDHGASMMARYQALLYEYDVDDTRDALAGD
ncbi:MAG: hypothetical protein ACFE0Q_06050 [Anaerolineae bacterium]